MGITIPWKYNLSEKEWWQKYPAKEEKERKEKRMKTTIFMQDEINKYIATMQMPLPIYQRLL